MWERSRQLIFGNDPQNTDNESSGLLTRLLQTKTVYATNEAINIVNKHDREGKALFAKGVNTENM